ncbi:glucose/arabinose dehydrogenase [Alteromonas sp. 76-1]|uniref:PQQ-dependent sugar dehydrogenase n=1 Tax=Alteromonas sp. 76-1 TaxID=2358187 RepID=UPI000FD1765B|nr:PQQ-dependent sugar dehydrogenase [Alteromonas sp. 76-1]VEL95746.1 glucose/arabinose dehydrogenase [Alteromonas sp. 76-1]
MFIQSGFEMPGSIKNQAQRPTRYLTLMMFTCLSLLSVNGVSADTSGKVALEVQTSDTAITRVIADTLHYPKALLQLPDSRWLVAERDGRIVTVPSTVVSSDKPSFSQVLPLPQLYQKGQGGLLHMALSPDFSTSKVILFSYSKGTDDANRLAVMRGVLTDDGQIKALTPVIEIKDSKATPVHFGGKLVAMEDGTWLVTTGDGFDYREQAQVLSSQLGKVLRFTLDGKPVSNVPFNNAPFVYTLGHRNPQGLVKLQNGDVYLHEHGPDGGDELNKLTPGMNYGWPVVTLGKDYSGATISPFNHYEGMVDPLVDWTPSIAPSSMAVYNHNAFPTLTNHLLVSALKAKALYAVDLSSQPFQYRKVFSSINQRVRDVAVGRDGGVYALTDGESAELIQLLPPDSFDAVTRPD